MTSVSATSCQRLKQHFTISAASYDSRHKKIWAENVADNLCLNADLKSESFQLRQLFLAVEILQRVN